MTFQTINKSVLSIAICPPKDKDNDILMVNLLLNNEGKKIICGGSTAKIFSRIMNKELKVILTDFNNKIPPKACIEGIDLVTEGAITLSKLNEIFKKKCIKNKKKVKNNNYLYGKKYTVKLDTSVSKQNKDQQYIDPVKELAGEIEFARNIKFIIGTSENKEQSRIINKQKIIHDLIKTLEQQGKKIEIEKI